MEKNFEIPFGAKDSELMGCEYTIPEGYEAEIKDGKVIIRKVESENEKIRKSLVNYINAHGNGGDFTKEEYIAWLEKQGKHGIYKESFNEGYKLGYREASENIAEEPEKYGLQKQGEQKPVSWSEDDKKMLNQIIKDYERGNESWLKGQGSLPFGDRIIWLKSLRPLRSNGSRVKSR